MAANIQLFQFQGQDVRVVFVDSLPYWILADICKVLDLDQVHRVADRLKQDGVTKSTVTDALGREQEMLCINEPNLYRTIFRSNKPEAVVFQDWVFEEVLPAIRKTGSYSINGDFGFNNYDEIKHLDLQDKEEPLRQAIQFYEDLILSCRADLVFLRRLERENFPGKGFTRGKRNLPDTSLYLKQIADRYQFGIKIVGKEVVIQKGFWGQDRAM